MARSICFDLVVLNSSFSYYSCVSRTSAALSVVMSKAVPIHNAFVRYWTLLTQVFGVTVMCLFIQALRQCPPLWQLFTEYQHKRGGFDKTGLKASEWSETIGSWEAYKESVFALLREASLGTVSEGEPAPNVTVYKLSKADGSTVPCNLLDFAKEGRPLVINFGSCSWPPFLANLEQRFGQTVREYGHMADFLIVYTREIHPSDEWSLGKNTFDVVQAMSVEQRAQAAMFVAQLDIPCPVLLDNMDDESCKLYGSTPERLYIVQDKKVVYKGARGPHGYKLEEIDQWLNKYQHTNNTGA